MASQRGKQPSPRFEMYGGKAFAELFGIVVFSAAKEVR